MAAANLLALIDDIASILDDVSVLSKVAAKKTAGVLGDDLALNAQQVSGVNADRELPVVWAVAKGSMKNKAILVPAALAISALIPWAITPLLMLGGLYLCYEGFEKIVHSLLHRKHAHHEAPADDAETMSESDKISGAVRTDFILSAEIIVIALGTVAAVPFIEQVAVLAAVAILMTVGVYGIVALIVKLDDAGLYLSRKDSGIARATGNGLLWLAPWLMKSLSVLGTAAMFLVGGSIILHGFPGAHHLVEHVGESMEGMPTLSMIVTPVVPTLVNLLAGLCAGALALAGASAFGKIAGAFRKR